MQGLNKKEIGIFNKTKKQKKQNESISPPNVIILSFYATYITNTLNLYNIRIGQIILLVMGSIGCLYTLWHSKKKINLYFIIFLNFYTMLGLVSYLIIGNASIFEYLWPLAYGGVTLVLLNYKISYKKIYILFYVVCIYYILNALNGFSAENVTGLVSRNNLSVTLLVIFSLLCIVSYMNNKKISIVSIVIMLLLSSWAVGRSGIITFSIILIGYFMLERKNKKQKEISIKSLIIISSLIIFVYLSRNLIYKYFLEYAIYNFEIRGVETSRYLITKSYLYDAFESWFYFMFGVNLERNTVFTLVNQNLHNSFLNLHSRYGIIAFIFFTIAILIKILNYIKTKNGLYLVLLLAIVFRSNFDLVAFNGVLDIYIYYFLFEGLYNKQPSLKFSEGLYER